MTNPTNGDAQRLRRALTLALDHCIIVAGMNPGDSHHEDVAGLLAAAQSAGARLVVSTGVRYDQEKDEDDQRRQALSDWITSHGIQRLGGPFTLDHSRLDSGDFILGDDDAEMLERLHILAWPMGTSAPTDRRKYNDWFHYTAAVTAGADGFVTTDARGVLPRLKRHNDEIPVPILDADEAAAVCRGMADRTPPD